MAGVPTKGFDADFQSHGAAAERLRNARMLVESKPDLVIAFPGGEGTADLVSRAKAAGVPVEQAPDEQSASNSPKVLESASAALI